MEIWNLWLVFITNSITHLSVFFGLSEALAIIAFTLISRAILMPVSLRSAYNMHLNRLAIEKIKPEIDRLKSRYKDDPAELSRRTLKIYKKNGIRFIDRLTFLNIGSQGFLGLGIFHAVRQMVLGSKFFWIANIAKPDVVLAVFVGVLTYVSMLLMPGVAEQHTMLIYLVPALLSFVFLITFPSALGLYWAASNIATIFQTMVLRYIIHINRKKTAVI